MEEILASIRRIIADDQEAVKPPEPVRPPVVLAPAPLPPPMPLVPPPQAASPPPSVDEEDVLDLAEVAPLPVRPAPALPPEVEIPEIAFREADESPDDFDAVSLDQEPEPEPEPPPPPPRPEPSPILRRADPPLASNEDHLISSATDATVGQAFNLLANTVLSTNTRTLEDLVREMLRPMLKHWLDDNLPGIVERLVRAEIERVARGK